MTMDFEFIFGSSDVFSLVLEQVQGLSSPQVSGERYGINLEPVDDLNEDGYDEFLICSIDYDSIRGYRQISL